MSNSSCVELEVEGAIATLTMVRAEAYNALDPAMARALRRTAAAVAAMSEVRVMVLRGRGKGFCSGGDVPSFAEHLHEIEPFMEGLLTDLNAFIMTLRRMPQCVITSVHGAAAGAGMSLALAADLCIASSDTVLYPTYLRLGVSPDAGGTLALSALVGARRALEIYLLRDQISAQQAQQFGLVSRVVGEEELPRETAAVARRIAAMAPAAVRNTKRLVRDCLGGTPEAQLLAESARIIECMQAPECQAALREFRARRGS